MSDERNGKLERQREARVAKENEQREIDEYNKRAMQYNGSNYYEGMEYKIRKTKRERKRKTAGKRKRMGQRQ